MDKSEVPRFHGPRCRAELGSSDALLVLRHRQNTKVSETPRNRLDDGESLTVARG